MFSSTLTSLSFEYSSEQQQCLITYFDKDCTIILKLISKRNEITNAEFLRTDHGYFNRPIDHQSTTNDRLKPVLTTGLVNTHIDRSIANPG